VADLTTARATNDPALNNYVGGPELRDGFARAFINDYALDAECRTVTTIPWARFSLPSYGQLFGHFLSPLSYSSPAKIYLDAEH